MRVKSLATMIQKQISLCTMMKCEEYFMQTVYSNGDYWLGSSLKANLSDVIAC